MKLINITAALILLVIGVSAQQNRLMLSTVELPAPYSIYQKGIQANNYLTPILQLQRLETEYLSVPEMRETYFEYLTLLHSYVGNYREAYFYEEKFLADLEPRIKFRARNVKDLSAPSPLDNHQPLPALEAIGDAAQKRQIIIINEEHRTPVHRALTYRSLKALYDKGFRYLAVETLRADDIDLIGRGYPTVKTGYYTFDPVFGDIIRQAIKIGFKTIAYEAEERCPKSEDFIACANFRERLQAQNIYNRILKDNPNARILVHAGRGHASKAKENNGFAFMARHLWQISRVEPFTVDQENYSERFNRLDERPLYRYAVNKNLLLPEPTVFKSGEGKFFSDSEGYDLRVFTPRAQYANGRPDWLKLGGARKAYKLNLKKLGIKAANNLFMGSSPILIQAIFPGENSDAIPVDQLVLYPKKEIPVLMLPAGEIQIRASDENGKLIGEYKK